MPTVSDDLLHELLSFLPSKDLLRLRCVSKSWRALIDSPYFIQLHLNKSLKDIKSRKVLVVGASRDGFYAISVDSEFKFAIREIKPPIQNLSWLKYIGSCRSLICLKFAYLDNEYEHKIVVWNPSTHSHRILPFSPVIEIEGSECPYNQFRYAFGYNEVADDYMVVRLTFNLLKYKNDYEAKVYSLKSDTWKEIDKVPIPCSSSVMSRPILANGAIIWRLQEWGDTAFSLLILPLRTQVLQFVSLPDDPCKFNFEFEYFLSRQPGISSCVLRDCNCRFRDVLKLINKRKNDTLTDLLLPDSDINDGMGYLKNSFHEKLCSEVQSFVGKIRSNAVCMNWEYTCCNWVDSLFRVER